MIIKLIFLIHIFTYIKSSDIIDLNEKKPPKKNRFIIRNIQHSNNGYKWYPLCIFPKDLELQNSKNKIIKYKSGGLTYIGKYILREEWEDRFYG